MSEKRYFKIEYDEEWYLFDSTTISEQLVKEQAEYGYGVFANSLSPSEVVGLLNEQQAKIEKIEKENRELNSIKKFAEKNGINIFLIDEAFRKCWKDNGKLFEENEQLKEENEDFRQRIKELQRSREYWIQDNNRLTKKNNELIAKIDFLERVIDGDV